MRLRGKRGRGGDRTRQTRRGRDKLRGMAAAQRVLVVEDEPSIADTLVYALKTEGFAVDWVSSGEETLRRAVNGAYAAIVLDIGLPDLTGFEVCRRIRRTSQVPILFLTARNAEVDRIVGLEIGGDDYVVKPFSPREVTARVRAILRRTATDGAGSGNGGGARRAKGFEVDAERRRIAYQGADLVLTRNEYRLLKTLVERPGRVFSRDELLDAAWDDPGASMDRTVDAHIKMIRAKLRAAVPDADPIETHRGVGYSLREGS